MESVKILFKKYLIGFRSDKTYKKVIASIVYLFLILMALKGLVESLFLLAFIYTAISLFDIFIKKDKSKGNILLVSVILLIASSMFMPKPVTQEIKQVTTGQVEQTKQQEIANNEQQKSDTSISSIPESTDIKSNTNSSKITYVQGQSNDIKETPVVSANIPTAVKEDGYKLIVVDGGDISGNRQANVKVDVGYGDREYWAYTNEYGQLVKVTADKIILQNDATESVTREGRYYKDEAKVSGTERHDLDEGHVIADSLGGVSNAYNITPQNSVLNRHGDQAYMEDNIRKAGGCTNFTAEITYPDTKTQIPSHYKYTYTLKENVIVDEFDNVNPDVVNKNIIATTPSKVETTPSNTEDISRIDSNGNGVVTIAEARKAGFKMPIYSSHWLYEYMIDRDGDGVVGE